MATLNEIIARAEALRKESYVNSIDPERVGSIMSDTLKYLNEFQLQSGSMGLDKIYASVSAMNADTSPVSDLSGKPLKAGQLAVVVTSDPGSADNGRVYRFDKPGWTYISTVAGLDLGQEPGTGDNKVMSQKAVTDLVSEYNVSVHFPTDGIDGTNRYTLETAIAKVPAALRRVGIKCSFLNEAGLFETWELLGGNSTKKDEWMQVGGRRLKRIDLLKYDSMSFPTSGNLIDPSRVVRGFYFSVSGNLIQDDKFGYTYIPMRGHNITVNYSGGFHLLAVNEFGECTHANENSTETEAARTLKFQEGDVYAALSIRLTELGKTAACNYGDEKPQYLEFGTVNKQDFLQSEKERIATDKAGADIICAVQKRQFDSFEYNLFDASDPDCMEGVYLSERGNLLENSEYAVSGFIVFNEDMKRLILSVNGKVTDIGGGHIVLYDKYKNVVFSDSITDLKGIVTWRPDTVYARFSIAGYKRGRIQIEVGNVVTEYKEFDRPIIKRIPQQAVSNSLQLKSLLGQQTTRISGVHLSTDEVVTLSVFPWYLKKGLQMSFCAKIEVFSAIYIGKGYEKYRGDWLKIDSEHIEYQHYEDSMSEKGSLAHGLNISNFIMVNLSADTSGRLGFSLVSIDGSFQGEFDNWGYEANYEAFVKSEGSQLDNVTLCAANPDFRCPIWAFGDSYFGISSSRWPGVMKSLGYFNYLIDGLAGQSSKGAWDELQRCLYFGTPKYLLWCLGMNDNDDTFERYFNDVRSLCVSKGITMVASTIPTTPIKNKEIITQIVRDSGLRYVDFYKAVGSNPDGHWYDGYLASDDVHPTDLGAAALAMQVLTDFPELMQF